MATITPSKPVATPSKHVFDNSQQHVFSAKAGQALPILSLETIPNGDYEINVDDLLRTMPLNEAAYIRAKQNVDFFFVPYSQLFTRFNQFFAQREDPVIAGSEHAKYVPCFDLYSFVLSVNATPDDDPAFADMFDFSYRYQVGKILDLLGYGYFPLGVPFTQVVHHTDIGGDKWDNTLFTPEWLEVIGGVIYGTEYASQYADLFEAPAEHPFRTTLKSDWLQRVTNFLNGSDPADPRPRKFMVNPFRAAAYCKIWNDFYRNPYRDEPLDPHYFNYDDIPCTTDSNCDIANSTREWTGFTDTFNMRYRRWKNDIFTASFPNAQFGDASIVPLDLGSAVDYIALQNPKFSVNSSDGSYTYPNNIMVQDNIVLDGQSRSRVYLRDDATTRNGSVTSIWSNNISFGDLTSLGFSVAQLRQAIAMQHWAENVIRAGNRTEDNMRAHFGVTPRYENEMHVKFLGSYDGTINLNVVSTTNGNEVATDANKKTGSLAANGISSLQGNRINYHANDFGIIMAVFSILPEAEYNAVMCDRANIKIEPFDFPTPEFQNIGFQPITNGDIRFSGDNNLPVGYVFPYFEYKTALDKVHGEFMKRKVRERPFQDIYPEYVAGSKAAYVSPRWQMQFELLRDVRTLYVNPRVYDSVFGVAADDKQSSDQFNITMFFNVKSRLPLSVLGLPQY